MRRAVVCLLALAAGAGCRRDGATPPPIAWPVAHPACAAPPAPPGAWRHRRSALVARLAPRHVAGDVVVAHGRPVTLDGKLAYGDLSKDLEDETVTGTISGLDCVTRALGTAISDDDGRVRLTAGDLGAGHHRYWLTVTGDGTTAAGGLWVLPGPTPAVLFDVDGTLTTSDGELLDELVGRGAEAYPGAAAIARRWAEKGYLVVYVTGRPYPLRALTRRWLDAGGFPYGPLFTPDQLRAGVPSRDGVAAYKRRTLQALQAEGLRIVRAYGNAATDVCAYAEAGIAPEATYILGTPVPCDDHPRPHALPGYLEHLADVDAQPAAR